MGRIIIILIVIIGGIVAFWWLGLLLLIILSEIWMPLLILLGLLLLGSLIVLAFNKSKQSKKHKKYILVSVFTILFLFVIVTIVKNTITYPIIINSYDGDKIKKYTEKLISDSYENKKESVILFANLKFGMTPKEIINNVIKYSISKTIYFNDYTPSKIIIGNTSFETDIKYYFDSTNKLRGIEIKCKSNEDLFEDEVVKYYGKKYMKRGQFIWLFNNARVTIRREECSTILEIFDISDIMDRNYGIEFEKFEDKSYNGKIIGDKYIKSNNKNDEFLANNKTKKGVQTTASGLQYKIVKQGKGVKPTVNDIVRIQYRLKLTNGKVIESTFERGQEPVIMGMTGIIPGEAEGLQLMSEGSTFLFWLSPELGYGDVDFPEIPAGSILFFEVQLVEVVKK